jgi:hypothetical protein
MAANRVKTVEYMLPNILTQVTQVAAAGTYTDSADATIYIPETTSRVILSAVLEVTAYNYLYTNSSNVSGWGVRCSCNAGANWTSKAVVSALNESDENYQALFMVDMTAEFTARFAGTSDTCRWGYYIYGTASTTGWSNASAKLIITYEYDDTAHDTRLKTVRIPIESRNGRVTTTWTAIGQGAATEQIPILTGAGAFLPEASVVIRQKYLELWGNTLPGDTTDAAISLRMDAGGTTYAYQPFDNTQDSSSTIRLMWDISAESSGSAHSVYAAVSAGTQYVNALGGWMTVTYEYNHGSSTTILNSLLVGLGEDSDNVKAVADKSVASVTRYLEEPSTLTMLQSAVWCTYQGVATTNDTLTFKVGAQTATGYTPTHDGVMCGMSSFVHRFDAGGYRGSSQTLIRGENTFTAEWYSGVANRIANFSCMMLLNYTSGKSAGGDGVHAHSCYFPLMPSTSLTTIRQASASVNPKIIESNYWLLGVMPMIYVMGIGATVDGQVLSFERLSAEGNGWEQIFNSMYTGVGENGCWINNGVARSAFKRWPNDTDTSRVDIEGARTWRIFGTNKQYGLGMWITYHSHTFTISGTVSGYVDADGAGLTVRIFRVSDGLCIGTTTTTAGGNYTMTWYDDTEPMRAICEEDASHVGASAAGTAT